MRKCVQSVILLLSFSLILSVSAQWLPDNGSGIQHNASPNDDGTVYQFRFLTTTGINYCVESSEDLNQWTEDILYRGIGHTITHPLFPIPQNDGSNTSSVANPKDYVPPIVGNFRIKEITINGSTTGLLVAWVSLDDEQPKAYVLYGKQIDEDLPPLLYSQNFDNYLFYINFTGEITHANDVPPNSTLGTHDAALIGKLVDSLPAINAEITANTAAQAAAPPIPPMVGGKKFYRIRKIFIDSDGDSLLDHVEHMQGLNMWSNDTDGDGLKDNEDSNPLVNDAVADPDNAGLDVSLSNGLLARYDFEVLGGGTFTDKSGNDRHATANGDTTVDTLGMVSRAAKFGSSGYLSASSILHGQSNHSESFWICSEKDSIQNSNGNWRTIHATTAISTGTAQSRFFGVRRLNGNETWVLGDYRWDYNGGSPTSSITGLNWTLPLGTSDSGKWHHIVTVQAGNTAKVYMDGVEVASGALSAIPAPASINAVTNFIVGRTLPASSVTQFVGKIDRMRIYSRALSAAEVTQILHQDIDRDGLHDRTEQRSLLWRDSNGDGIKANAECFYTANPFRWDSETTDHDSDGLSSLSEQNTHGTDIANPDSDGDLIPDGFEANNGLNPTDPSDANGDDDNDNVSNINEYIYKSDPQLSDSDGDNTHDDVEISQGSNPHDASDNGDPIPPEEKLTIKIGVGDQSGSESEDYVMNIFRLNPETGEEEPFYTLRSGGHGQYTEKTLSIFRKSDNYTFQIDWQSSNLGSSEDSNNPEGPDYDYTFIVEPQNDDNGFLVDRYDPRIKRSDQGDSIGGDKNDVENFPNMVELMRIARGVGDLDVVHPVTSYLADTKEIVGDGGYVSVKRIIDDGVGGEVDSTPVTELSVRRLLISPNVDAKFRLKFDSGDRYKIYSDAARTQEVISEQTEFIMPKLVPFGFYIQGEKKSIARGGEEVMLQVEKNNYPGTWITNDRVKFTCVQSEFQIQMKAFIPYGWTEAEEEVPGLNILSPMYGKVAKGDLHSMTPGANLRPAFPGFRNIYSDNSGKYFHEAPFRVMQAMVLTPYKDLHESGDKVAERKVQTAPLSVHYDKSTGVDPSELHLKKGFKDLLAAGLDRSGKPSVTQEEFRNLVRNDDKTSITIEGAGKDGAMGTVMGIPVTWATADIHWEMGFEIRIGGVGANPLQPALDYTGSHDSYPAYEIIVLQSDGSFTNVHRLAPPAASLPGPSTLDDDNAVPVAGVKIITQ